MRFLRVLCIVFISYFVPSTAFAEWHVGYRSISTWNSRENVRLDVGVWYPGRGEERFITIDEYRLYVARNTSMHRIVDEAIAGPALEKIAQIREKAKEEDWEKEKLDKELDLIKVPYKKYPLILLSHTSGSTRYSYHTLADLLVKAGYIVAVPMHSQDNAHDMRNFYSAKSIYQRARQCSLALDLLLTDPYISPFIDSEKISFVGFGSGGTAGLLLAGAELSLDFYPSYCSDYDEVSKQDIAKVLLFEVTSQETNVLCQEPMRTQLQNFALSLQKTIEKSFMENLFYFNAVDAKELVLEKAKKILEFQVRWSKRNNPALADYVYEPPFLLPYLPPLPTQYTYSDSRFKNYIFVAPGLTVFYKLDGLKKSKANFMVIGLERDFINKPQFEAEPLAKNIGAKAQYAVIPKADLWALQAPCYGANMLVEICKSVSEDERESIHNTLYSYIMSIVPHFEN